MEPWLEHVHDHLSQAHDVQLTPRLVAQLIHEALEIAEAEKYATENSRFCFTFHGATEQDLLHVRSYLSPFENQIVELKLASPGDQ